jgi:aldose 1-epimerase
MCFTAQKFPGTVETTATYTLDEDNKLTLVMEATTDKATPINLVNHAYFNLNGQANGTILDHVLQIPNG